MKFTLPKNKQCNQKVKRDVRKRAFDGKAFKNEDRK